MLCCDTHPGPVELSFTGDTPLVIENDIFVNLSVSPVKSLRCELVTRGTPGNPIISRAEDCKDCIWSTINYVYAQEALSHVCLCVYNIMQVRVVLSRFSMC